jgi:hypothetical protein
VLLARARLIRALGAANCQLLTHMKDNLEQQFDEVIGYVGEYWRLLKKLRLRSLSRIVYKAHTMIPIVVKYGGGIGKTNQDILSGRTPERVKEIIGILANEEEKHTEFYEALISDYSIDQISRNMEKRFGNVDFGKIKKLHEMRRGKFLKFSFWQYAGFALVVASLILKTVPKKVVEYKPEPEMKYEDFEVWVFWISMVVTAYLILTLIPIWWSFRKNKQKHDFISEVLEYCSLKQSGN